MTNDEKVDAMVKQFEAASDPETIRRLLTGTINSVLLHRISGDQYEHVVGTITPEAVTEAADREFNDLPEDERRQVAEAACAYVRNALTEAVMHTWTVCHTLNADPLTIGPETIAFITAMYAIPPKPTSTAG